VRQGAYPAKPESDRWPLFFGELCGVSGSRKLPRSVAAFKTLPYPMDITSFKYASTAQSAHLWRRISVH